MKARAMPIRSTYSKYTDLRVDACNRVDHRDSVHILRKVSTNHLKEPIVHTLGVRGEGDEGGEGEGEGEGEGDGEPGEAKVEGKG